MNPAMDDANNRIEPRTSGRDFAEGKFVDLLDDVILVGLDVRERQVTPGESVTFTVTLLNNGPKAASFRLRLEGWIRDTWVTLTPTHTWLSPGEGHRFELTIAPPALPPHGMIPPELSSGPRPFLLTVLSPEYPERRSQLNATLHLLPVIRCTLGNPRPKRLVSSWQNQSASTVVPVTNHGNVPAHIVLEGASKAQHRERACRFEFMTFGSVGHRLGQSQVTVEPGQTVQMHVRVTPVDRVLFGLRSETLPFCIAAWPVHGDAAAGRLGQQSLVQTEPAQAEAVQLAYGQVKRVPLIGAGLAATVAAATLCVLVAAGLLGLTTIMALLPARQVAQVAAPPIIVRAPEQPSLEIVVKVAEPVPSPRSLAAVESPERAMLTVADAIVSQASNSATAETVSNGDSTDEVIEDVANLELVAQSETQSPERIQLAPAPLEPAQLEPVQYVNGVPVVQAGMISQPDFGVDENKDRVAINPAQNISPQGGALVRAESVTAPSRATVPQTGPLTYERMFKEVAHGFDMDWRILAAQAYIESGFDPLATGTKGDMGLMQILPSTWAEWAPRTGGTDPYNGYHNVSVSAVYSNYLRDMFAAQGYIEPKWRLVAYNWGPNRLRIFLNEGRSWDDLPEARKKYANDILRIAASLPLE